MNEYLHRIKFIALGGCHIGSPNTINKDFFVDILEKYTNGNCIYKKDLFLLKNITSIESLITEYNPDFILLQLGNYEFEAPLHKLRKKKKKKKINDNTIEQQQNYSFKQSISLASIKQPSLSWLCLSILKLCISVPIFLLKEKKNIIPQIKLLEQLIETRKDQNFVVLTPFPCWKTPDNINRRYGRALFQKYFSGKSNIIFIDIFEELPLCAAIFADRYHFNEYGHELIGKIIYNKIHHYLH